MYSYSGFLSKFKYSLVLDFDKIGLKLTFTVSWLTIEIKDVSILIIGVLEVIASVSIKFNVFPTLFWIFKVVVL